MSSAWKGGWGSTACGHEARDLVSPARLQVGAAFPMFVGCGRSGTTLVRAIFDSHPDLAVTHHAQFIVDMGQRRRRYETDHGLVTERFLADLFASHRYPLLNLTEASVRQLFEEPTPSYPDAVRRVLELYAHSQGKSRYGDKTPGHVLRIDLLAGLFPEARFVHVIRDGRSSWLGYRDRGFGPQSLPDAAFNWKGRVLRGRRAGQALGPDRYHEIRYEDLVEDPHASLQPLCAFLGLPFDESMLRFHERSDHVLAGMGASGRMAFENVSRPVTAGMRAWRDGLSDEELQVFEAIAGDLLADLGYERAGAAPSAAQRLVVARSWAQWQGRRASFQVLRLARRLHLGATARPDDWGHAQPTSLPGEVAPEE